jgi:hypothetical protein
MAALPDGMQTVFTIWATALSTGLAGVKAFELFRDRARLTVSYGFTAEAAYGPNTLTLENPSKTPIMLTYWELYWLEPRPIFKTTIVGGRTPNAGYCNITIAAQSRHTLEFADKEWFPIPQVNLAHSCKLVLFLHVVGRRRPLRLTVWPRRRGWATASGT